MKQKFIALLVALNALLLVNAQSIEAFRPYLPSERVAAMFDKMVEFESSFDDALAVMSYDVDPSGTRQYQLQFSLPLTHAKYNSRDILTQFEPLNATVESLSRGVRTADVKFNYNATGGARNMGNGKFADTGSSKALVVTHGDEVEKFATQIDDVAVVASLTWSHPDAIKFLPVSVFSLDLFFRQLPNKDGDTAWKKDPTRQEWNNLLELFYRHVGADENITLEYSRAKRRITLTDRTNKKTYKAEVKGHTLYLTITRTN